MEIQLERTDLSPATPFGFSCNRCLGCCRDKKIQLNPYEVARLAGHCGIDTTEFIERYTDQGGTLLKFRPDGRCIFLDAEGCGVHPARPLVCRLYPLGRFVDGAGKESFAQMALEPWCRGELDESGSIHDYLEEQQARPLMRAADRYLELLWDLLSVLEQPDGEPARREAVRASARLRGGEDGSNRSVDWLDVDRALAAYCRDAGIPVPQEVEDKMELHIAAVRQWAALLEEGEKHGSTSEKP